QRKWFFTVDILARLAGVNGDQRVPMVRSGHADRVEVFAFQHFAVITILFRSWPFLRNQRLNTGTDFGIDITNRCNIASTPEKTLQVVLSLIPDTNHPERHSLIGPKAAAG